MARFQIQASFFYVENHKNCTIPDFLAISLNFCQISLLSSLSYTEVKDLLLHMSLSCYPTVKTVNRFFSYLFDCETKLN